MSYNMDDKTYSEFLIPASDAQGHNVGVTFRAPKEWLEQLNKILLSRKFPYTSVGYIIRHALFRHFGHLETLEDIPSSTVAQITAMIDLLQEDMKQRGFMFAMEKLEETVNYYRARGDINRATGFVLKFMRKAEGMSDEYWRDHVIATLKERYGELMDEVPNVSLGDLVEEDKQ